MKRMLSRIVTLIMMLVLGAGCFSSMSLAAETEIIVEEIIDVDTSVLPDNDELFSAYVEQVLYSDLYEDVASYGNLGLSRLPSEKSKALYSELKTKIEEAAAGQTASAIFTSSLSMRWTAEELGVSKVTSANVKEIVANIFAEDVNSTAIIRCLLLDCPYDLYWYNKTGKTQTSYAISYGTNYASISNITVKMPVGEEFQNGDIYTINTAWTQIAVTAKNKAAEIVAANANASDYEKMAAYKTAICDMVSYNYPAADESTNTPYGNPWQLLWVFDGDESTKVVCEGYSKAFQYLCDLSGLTCYTVTGFLTSGTGAGAHMWNIVTLDGENYLVDLTNCDSGTVGYPDKLFLAGTPGSVQDGYIFPSAYNVAFTYSDTFAPLLGDDVLTLATSNYTVKTPDPTPEPEPEPEPETTPVTEAFSDIDASEWYVPSVQYVFDKGIMSGSEGLFKPLGKVTRAQVVSTLYRLAGSPKVTDYRACNEMVDVQAGEWYTDAVCWAYNTGVGTGNSATKKFNMNDPVTRQQLASFFFRYVGYKGMDSSATADLSILLNADKVASYAVESMKWAVGAGIISGSKVLDSTGNVAYDLAPEANATRAQLSSILQRFCEKYNI